MLLCAILNANSMQLSDKLAASPPIAPKANWHDDIASDEADKVREVGRRFLESAAANDHMAGFTLLSEDTKAYFGSAENYYKKMAKEAPLLYTHTERALDSVLLVRGKVVLLAAIRQNVGECAIAFLIFEPASLADNAPWALVDLWLEEAACGVAV